MPRNLPHYTRCAAPGVAHPIDTTSAITRVIVIGTSIGFIAYLVALAASSPCPYAIAVALGLIASLDEIGYWYYNQRLMCVDNDMCAIGTVVGEPIVSCDGDVKLDILIAPFRFREVENRLLLNSIDDLSATGTIPMPTTDVHASRDDRLAYVNQQLSRTEARALYFDLVENKMLAPGPWAYQAPYYLKQSPPMSPAAAANTPDGNPMFRFDADHLPGQGFIDGLFCQRILGVPELADVEGRLVPYMHCEIEGNRLQRGLTNLRVAILAFGAAYVAACAVCSVIAPEAAPWLCPVVAAGVALLIAWLIWLLSNLFNDPDDGEAGQVVKAWYLLCRDADGAVTTVDNPDATPCALDVTKIDVKTFAEMCDHVKRAETTDPDGQIERTTSAALSLSGGMR